MMENVLSGARLAMWTWKDTKWFVEHSIAFSSDALHVVVGVIVLLVTASILRRPISGWLPFLVVMALTLINETADILVDQWPERGMQFGESMRDILLTLFLPLVLLIALRVRPGLFGAARPQPAKPESSEA